MMQPRARLFDLVIRSLPERLRHLDGCAGA
jgi:hypothetical protein